MNMPTSTVMLICVLSLLAAGCQYDGEVIDTSTQQKRTTAPVPKQISGNTSAIEGDTFQVMLPSGKKSADQVLRVVPKPGYKVNLDFPNRVRFKDQSIASAPPKVEVSKASLNYTLPIQVDKAGQKIEVIADFSICNENSCKLYTAQAYDWQMK